MKVSLLHDTCMFSQAALLTDVTCSDLAVPLKRANWVELLLIRPSPNSKKSRELISFNSVIEIFIRRFSVDSKVYCGEVMHIALQGSEVTVSLEVISTRVLLPRMFIAVKGN